MIVKGNTVIFECDKDAKGNEIGNSSQRNNELVWPPVKDYPNAQYRTSWKNMCNVTSYVMALEYSGFSFPSGPYKQPEDNLGLHILTSEKLMAEWEKAAPAEYKLFKKALEGKCTEKELESMYFPTELHRWLCMGANEWIGTTAATFNTRHNLPRLLWDSMVNDNSPLVISTKFGGFGHIVCVTGVIYNTSDYKHLLTHPEDIDAKDSLGKLKYPPKSIIVDDPWGKYNPVTNKYDAPNGGNDIEIPWSRVTTTVREYNSESVAWAHTFKHGSAKI